MEKFEIMQEKFRLKLKEGCEIQFILSNCMMIFPALNDYTL